MDDKIRVVVAGVPFAYQQAFPDGRWLSDEHIARITGISPRIDLVHTARRELEAGFTPDPQPEVLFTEAAGADPELDNLPEVVTARDFPRLVTPRLRWVQSCAAGVEHLLPALDESVIVTNASGVHANAIAESVMAAVLLHTKRLRDRLDRQSRRVWEPLYCSELIDRTICILGTGDIGSRVAELAKAFRMRTIGVRRSPRPTPHFDQVVGPAALREVLPEADYVLVACPLTPETENMVGPRELAAMKRGAYFMNVARGRIVDEPALVRALADGTLGGAFLDAHVQEPLPEDHPFWSLPTVTVIPHDSHSSERIGDNDVELFCDNLARYVKGEPLRNVVDRTLGY